MSMRKPKIRRLEIKLSEKEVEIKKLSKVYASANAEIDKLKDKVCSYMESAFMYKSENEDLRARCNKLDKLLGEKEKQLETANTDLKRALNDKKIYFEAANTLKELNDELKASNKHNETLKNSYRELYEKEKQKSPWQKFKEGFFRG